MSLKVEVLSSLEQKNGFGMDKDWILGVYSSGGSAHERAIEDLSKEIPNIHKINILSSTCTYLPLIGTFCAWIWNRAQKKGNVGLQVVLGKLLCLAERLFVLPTRFTFYRLLLSREKKLPKKLIATVPLFLSAICRAVLDANAKTKGAKIGSIDVYMIEPPTDQAGYYFDTIKRLSKEKKQLIKLFAGHPAADDLRKAGSEENYWQEKTGLEMHQIVFDPPVKKVFKTVPSLLPFPGQQVELLLKGYKNGFKISAQDRVGLIMLGGIPTCEAILSYVHAAVKLAKEQIALQSQRKNYLFVACGKEELGLYKRVCAFLNLVHMPQHLEIIPFLNQPIEKIFGRSDFSITRTGGMTSLEIIQLKKRKEDDKTILLHAQLPKTDNFIFSQEEEDQEYLIKKGIPLWEAGNARYLRKSIPEAFVITPESSPFFMAKKFY